MEAATVTITCLDKPRKLTLNGNVLAEVEKLTGLNFGDPKVWNLPSWTTLRALLYCMAKIEDSSLTLEQVGSMLNPRTMPKVTESLVELMTLGLPSQEDVESHPLTQAEPVKPDGSGSSISGQ